MAVGRPRSGPRFAWAMSGLGDGPRNEGHGRRACVRACSLLRSGVSGATGCGVGGVLALGTVAKP